LLQINLTAEEKVLFTNTVL